jgi:hypothetical protein
VEHRSDRAQFYQGARHPLPQPELKEETTMTRIALFLAPLAFASAALAQSALPDVPDSDGNGTWSLVELQAVWTDMTAEGFTAIDTNADGAVDKAELQAALDNAVITAPATGN